MKLVGKLTEAELERRIADGSLKAELKAELAAEGKPWSEVEWEVATQIFGYTELDESAPKPEDKPEDRQMSATKDAWDKLGRDIEDGTAKRQAMAEVAAEGREWSELDENQWKAALFCLGYPPDMEQPDR